MVPAEGETKAMKDLLMDVVRFIWHRTSERAVCMAIMLTPWISERDCRQLGEYFKATADNKKAVIES